MDTVTTDGNIRPHSNEDINDRSVRLKGRGIQSGHDDAAAIAHRRGGKYPGSCGPAPFHRDGTGAPEGACDMISAVVTADFRSESSERVHSHIRIPCGAEF